MSTLRETQATFRAALLSNAPDASVHGVIGDGLAPAARIAIYRHHVAATLGELLNDVYPVVRRLVDARFFAYAADRFVAAHPPASPCLAEYGDGFPSFLAGFAPCRHLPYLPDVARLEWAMSRAQHAAEAPRLTLRALAGDDPGRRTLRMHPSLTLLDSAWPVDRIWRANQPDAEAGTVVALDAGSARLQVWRAGDDVVFRTMSPGDFTLRQTLADGATLDAAARATLALEPAFDLALALYELFNDGVVSAVLPSTKEARP